jgi:hypothetical protein
MSRDLHRIRLVTERYAELQGLRLVLVGCVFSVLFGGLLLVGGLSLNGTTLGVSVGLAFALIVPGMLWLDRYYERVFGRLSPRAGSHVKTLIVPGALVALLWLHPLVGAPRFSLYFLGWAAYALWTVWRDWPYRTYRLLDASAGLLAAFGQWRAAGSDEGFLLGLAVMGAAGVMTGFRDHRVLAEAVRPAEAGMP